ncbi:MAG: protein translocase subunit SecD [Candidatus Spechtbacterales bacterium]
MIAAFFAANLDYPKYWNQFADWSNPKLEAVDANRYVGQYDKWGVLRAIDNFARVPKFSESPYSLGLDLQGGIHLVYEANLSGIRESDQKDAMESLRDAIERRVNFLGVSEPVVQIEQGDDSSRLIVELAGISDPDKAIEQIGQTPFLEFKEVRPFEEQKQALSQVLSGFVEEQGEISDQQIASICSGANTQGIATFTQILGEDPCFRSTSLTGQFLERASVTTHPQTGELQIGLQFNEEGSELFEEITKRNIGSVVAIYLDGTPVSIPTVNQAIAGGQAVITGNFTVDEARELVRNLNAGALPVPISIIAQQRIGAALGEESLAASLRAGAIAVLAVLAFIVIMYRFSGLLAAVSLLMYIAFILALIKTIPITLTLAGIAGLILSIGMAVDANVLIFERLREELRDVENVSYAVDKAFERAWPSIRDGNISTLLTAVILFWFSTSFVQGFALTLGLGIVVSMFSAMVVTKYLMKLFLTGKLETIKFIWSR